MPIENKLGKNNNNNKKVEFVFPFLGKHEKDSVGYLRMSITMTTHRHWSIVWSAVVTAQQVTSAFIQKVYNTIYNKTEHHSKNYTEKKIDYIGQ